MKLSYGLFAAVAAVMISAFSCGRHNSEPEFIFGADISFVPQDEARGIKFSDNGTEKDIFDILKDHHFNYIRLRLFVDPTAENGYSKDGFCDLEHTVAMGKRIKATGMKFLLDFHYSDTWADPDKQYKPSAWEGLHGASLDSALYEYTRSVLIRLKEEDAAPDMIQLGNEVDNGMVWPDGRIDDTAVPENWDSFCNLYKAGEKAAREVLPEAQLMIHLALGGQNNLCRRFLDNMTERNAGFDIIGLSYYPQWHGTMDDLKANMKDLIARYGKPVSVCEYSTDRMREINDAVRSLSEGMGIGTMFWEPTRRGLFDRDGKTTPELAIYKELYKQYSKGPQPADTVVFARNVNFDTPIIGADVSWLQQQENRGRTFSDNGTDKGALEILKDYKFNWIRLRIFVDPTAENGYSREGYCGLDSTLVMAKRIKEAGMNLLLDFHYSDNWADPGKQWKPAAWEKLEGASLERIIYQYSNDVVSRLIEQGTAPDMVQIGNEINHGMIWPNGRINGSWMPFCRLLRGASAGVRNADPNIVIMVHIACGGQNDQSVRFFDRIISQDVIFDVIGQSYYPEWHGTVDDLRENLSHLAVRYGKPIIVVEYDEEKEAVNEIANTLPNGLGLGTFIWEATTPQWGGLFDRQGKTVEDIKLYPEVYKKFHGKTQN